MATNGFYAVDFVIFGVILVISLAIGVYYSCVGKKQNTTGEYFLADKKMHPLPVAMSMFMSYISGVMVMGNVAEMYTAGVQFWLASWGSTLAFIFSTIVMVPFFYKLTMVSSYEYYETRFHSKVCRKWASIMFILSSLVYIGLASYTPSVALNAVTGFPVWASVLACGLVATIYTTMGGMKAVVWTDTVQGLILIAGVIAFFVIGLVKVGGFNRVWEVSGEGGRLKLWDFNPDPTVRLTFWSTIFGRFFISLNYVGTGQTSIQRYSTLPSLRDAQISAMLNIPCILITYTLTCMCGLTVYAYYAILQCDPLANGDIKSSNQLLPYFIVDAIGYPGMNGLFVAILFSGALSSISSSLNSMGACTWKDFLESNFTKMQEWKKALVNKIIVAIYGFIGIGMSFMASELGGHVLQATQTFVGGMGGPSIGMFFLGMFFPCSNWQGALFGSLIGFALTCWMSIGAYVNPGDFGRLPTSTANCTSQDVTTIVYNISTYTSDITSSFVTTPPENDGGVFFLYRISYMYTAAIGCLVTLLCGLIISLITGGADPADVDPDLINPIFNRLCCCLPTRWLRKCWCGVDHSDSSEKDKQEDEHNGKELAITNSVNTETQIANGTFTDSVFQTNKVISLQSYKTLPETVGDLSFLPSYQNFGYAADLKP